MASITGRLDLASRRNEARLLTIRVVGADWSGLPWRQQVRLGPDTPGAPVLNIAQVNNANAEGLFVVGVTTENGLPVTTVRLRYNMSTMRDGLPYSGEVGADVKFAHAIQVNGQTRLAGDWWAVASVMDSDAAPEDNPESYGCFGHSAPAISAAAGIAVVAEEIVSIVIDGSEQLSALVLQSKAAVADAVSQVTLAAAQAVLSNASALRSAGFADAASRSATTATNAIAPVNAARDAALTNIATALIALTTLKIVYPDQASGLAASAEGGFFGVAGTGEVGFTLFRKVGGAAQFYVVIPGRAALDRLGRFVPAQAGVDNAIAINAALADPLVGGVVLGIGDYETRSAVQVPTGKFLTGAGRGATRLVATANIAALANVGKGVIVSNGTTGVRIGNLTVIAPKSTGVNGDKVQGVWMRNAKKWVVENVEAYNCGYAFWAHERSEDGIFRNLVSYNANVHFETTQAYSILFENLVSGDGDGDNPLGFEAVWHCLLASRNITFRRARHTGSGCPFLIIANDTNGDAQGGLIDDIRYEDCQAVNTDGKLGMQIANYNNLPVGRVALVDSGVEYGSPAKAGVPAIISLGKVSMRGGRWKSFSQENFIIYATASLDAVDVEVIVDANPTATGIVYNSDGPTRIIGGTITMTTAAMTVGAGATLYVSPTTNIVSPNTVYEPVGVGQRVSFVYPADIAKPSGYDGVLAQFGTTAGRTYRVMLAGKQRKGGADGLLAFYIDAASGPIASSGFGRVEMQDAGGAYQPTSDAKLLPAGSGDIRAFNMDLTFVGTGNQVSINFGGGDGGATIIAGARLTIDRMS